MGREPQLERLRAGFDDAMSGHGHILLLVGEPGIGKTRTAEELATYASMRGAQVLWGRCYEGEGAPAYWPWLQVIRSWVHDREPEKHREHSPDPFRHRALYDNASPHGTSVMRVRP